MDPNEEIITEENADEILELVKNIRETLTNRRLLNEINNALNKMEAIAKYAKGENVTLSYRIQTAGEYNPPMHDEYMKNEMFRAIIRKTPWYVKA